MRSNSDRPQLGAGGFDRRAVMRDAHKRYRDGRRLGLGWTFAQCLKTAWAAARIRQGDDTAATMNRIAERIEEHLSRRIGLPPAAARYAIELEREGKERQAAIGTANLTGKCVSNDTDLEIGYSRDKAAEKFNESPATVARAVKVVKEGSDEIVKNYYAPRACRLAD